MEKTLGAPYKFTAEGQIVEIGLQVFRCVGFAPHMRLDGSRTNLAVLVTRCAICAEEVRAVMPAAGSQFYPKRRCDAHKRPGAKVPNRAKRAVDLRA